MIATWNQWEGVCLAGEYGLEEWLGESDNSAFFRARSGSDQRPALLKLTPTEMANAGVQLKLWREQQALPHPALLELLDFGTCAAGGGAGDSYLFAVYEFPDDTLEAALGGAPLQENEKREIREAVSAALGHLHSHGFVHGAIDAGHVVASGNTIKLLCDAISRASDEHTPAEDWRKLELLLPGSVAEPPAAPLAAPLAAPTPPAAPAPPAPSPDPMPAPQFTLPRWAIGAVAVVLVAGGFWLLPKASQPIAKNNPRPAPTPVAAIKPISPAPPAEQQRDTLREWRVIAYTYSSHQAAERKAAAITEKWPEAAAEVFRPKGTRRTPYLVALGGWMTRDEAVRLLKAARGKGLPRDTYIQNYMR
ncbi:MAG TPA: hypothetical protein VKV17_14070 [Bryobacteraceae bacterium]|nr:hypothetical protein [Bryobacteraceae bacterium]